jgi:hypothetical protein
MARKAAVMALAKTNRILESSYLLDATSPNLLWFDEFGKWNWLNLNGLLSQAVEELAA